MLLIHIEYSWVVRNKENLCNTQIVLDVADWQHCYQGLFMKVQKNLISPICGLSSLHWYHSNRAMLSECLINIHCIIMKHISGWGDQHCYMGISLSLKAYLFGIMLCWCSWTNFIALFKTSHLLSNNSTLTLMSYGVELLHHIPGKKPTQ